MWVWTESVPLTTLPTCSVFSLGLLLNFIEIMPLPDAYLVYPIIPAPPKAAPYCFSIHLQFLCIFWAMLLTTFLVRRCCFNNSTLCRLRFHGSVSASCCQLWLFEPIAQSHRWDERSNQHSLRKTYTHQWNLNADLNCSPEMWSKTPFSTRISAWKMLFGVKLPPMENKKAQLHWKFQGRFATKSSTKIQKIKNKY